MGIGRVGTGILVLVALAIAPAAAQAGSVQSLTVGTTPVELAFDTGRTFNADGTTTYYDDKTIWNHLAGMISRADPGSSIGLSVYVADSTSTPVQNALHAAAQKSPPVSIWVVDNACGGVTCMSAVTDPWFKWVAHYKACTGPCLSNNDPGIMHAKYAIFSSTHNRFGGPSTKATWVSSANMNSRTGQEEYNSALAYYGSSNMYASILKLFQDQWSPELEAPAPGGNPSGGDYFDPATGQGYFGASEAHTIGFVSPEQETDLWYGQLHAINPLNPLTEGLCRVHVMQAEMWDYPGNVASKPAAELARLYDNSCAVAVLVHRQDDGDLNMGDKTAAALCNAGVPVKSIKLNHEKFVITSPRYNTYDNNPQVMMGSTNMSYPAAHYNDELLLRIYNSWPLYDAFEAHFHEAWVHAQPRCNA
jgi:hypothetical protein